jgi:hypothetical protein
MIGSSGHQESGHWVIGSLKTIFTHTASLVAGKGFNGVILSEAKDLALHIFTAMRDSSSPTAPLNDTAYEYFLKPFGRKPPRFHFALVAQRERG